MVLPSFINPPQKSNSGIFLILLLIAALGRTALAANRYSVASGNWNSTSTWSATSGGASGASVPVSGDAVFIEGGYAVTLDADMASTISSLTVSSGSSLSTSLYTFGTITPPTSVVLENGSTASAISGSGTLTLGGNVTVNYTSGSGSGATISCPVALGSYCTFTVADEMTSAADLTISGLISGPAFGITKAGAGTLVFTGANTYTGATTVSGGTLLVNNVSGSGTGTGTISVMSGATLGGTGSIGGGATVSIGGTMSPGSGIGGTAVLTINNNLTLAAGADYSVNINGTVAGSNYDQCVVNGTFGVTGATLSINLGYAPTASEQFVLCVNDGVDAITGTFTGLAEGSIVTADYGGTTYEFTVSYMGGTGNDLVLTALAPEDYATWSNSKSIYLNTSAAGGANVMGNVYNFPVLVRLDTSRFDGFINTQPGGADIRFSKTNGTHLYYEIERWVDNAGNNDTALIWVKVDTVLGNNATQQIIMHWGKSGAVSRSVPAKVFDTANGFTGVWHLAENPSGGTDAIKDATSNAVHATSKGGMGNGNLVDGIIGKSHYYDGSDDADSIPYAAALNTADAVTVSAWVKATAFQSYSRIISRGMPTNADPWTVYSLGTNSTNPQWRCEVSSGVAGSQASALGVNDLSIDTWYYTAFTYDRSNMKVFRNGSQDGSSIPKTDAMSTNQTTPLMIGKSNYASNPFGGSIDEARISRVARSVDWIKLCYENQKPDGMLISDHHTATWTGSVNGQWSNPSNWSPAGVPGSGDVALFNATAIACSLTVNDTVGGITFTSGYNGGFYYNGKTLSVEGNSDFRSNGPIYTGTGILEFIGPLNRTFIPKAGAYTANQIRLNGTGVTTVQTNGFQCVTLTLSSGTLDLGSGLADSVAGSMTLSAGSMLNFGSSTLKFGGTSLSLNSAGTIIAGTGTLEFCRGGGNAQVFIPKPSFWHPAIVHSGADTLRISSYPLVAASYSQSAGTVDLNGMGIDTLSGNLTITNGGASSIVNLSGMTIRVGGNATLSGQPGNLLNLDPFSAWSIRAHGTLSASYAAIRNSNAAGGGAGTATNSYDLGGNSNWASISGNPRVEPGPSNLTLGGGLFTNGDSLPLMHLRALTSQAEGAYLDTIRAKMTKGQAGAINYMRLFADIDRNGSFNPPTDTWLKDTTVTVADSTVCFARGAGMHLDSLDAQDTSEYWLVMDLNSTTLSSTDTFMFSTTPPLSRFRGRTSYLDVNGGGSAFMGDTAWGMQGGLLFDVGDSNGVIGKPVLTDQDSIPCMHFTLSATSTEKVVFDTMRVRMVKGNRLAIDKLSFFRDDGAIGSYEPVLDSLVWEATVAADSVATFWQTGGFDSIPASQTKRYWLMLHLNSTTIGTNDTFRFSMNADSMVVHGASSHAGFPVSGGTILGDVVPGDEVPYVTEVTASTASGRYGIGATVSITVNLSENVTVAGGTPAITLETGTTDREATYANGSGTNALTFEYTVMAGDASSDLDYVSSSALVLSGATIRDVNNHDANLMLPTPGTTGSLADTKDIRIDGSTPMVPSTSISAPNGGEVWLAGSSQNINWNNAGITDDLLKNNPISLYYSIDGGTSFPNLIAGDLTNSGTYSWTVAAENSAQIRVRITVKDSAGNESHDTSNNNFTIDNAAPTVAGSALTSPNGGEVWAAGSSQNITWNTGDISDVMLKNNPISLYYSTDNGSTFPNLIASDLANSGTYSWTVASENSTQVRVRITVTDSIGNASHDTSTGSFTIDNAAPTVATTCLTSPNGGEMWAAGASQSITWNTGDISDVALKNNPISLYYSTDNGTTFPNLIVSDIANSGSYSWTVASENSGSIRVRILVTDSLGNTMNDASDASFTIDNAAPTVASTCLTAPNGGEVWAAGTSHNITWNTGDISDVMLKGNPISLYYSTDNGSTFPNLIASNLTNNGSFIWTVASENNSSARVRITVTDSAGNIAHDVSDAVFTIDNGPPSAGSLAIADNGGVTNSAAPVLSIAAIGADSMRFRLNGGSWSAWEPYAGTKTGFAISAGGEGVKIIDVMFSDRAGNVSAVFSDSTLYDVTPPANVTGLVATGFGGNSIALAWTPSISTDADSIMIRYSESAYPADTGGGAWWKRTGAAKNSDTITGLAATALYYTGLFVRDSAGNWSSATAGSRDTAYVPVNPPGPLAYGRIAVMCTVGVAIPPNNCVNGGAPADSFVIAPDLPVGLLFERTTGRISGTPVVAYAPTTHVVTAINAGGAAICTVTVEVSYKRPVAGFYAATLSGAAPLNVVFTDTSSGNITSRRWSFGDGSYDTAASVFYTYANAGVYTISLLVSGPGGSDSLVKISLITVTDTTPPQPITGLVAFAQSCSSAVLTWTSSTSADADSVAVCGSLVSPPMTPGTGEYRHTVKASAASDSMGSIPKDGVTLFVALFVKDKSNNWSKPVLDTLVMPDCVPPQNTLQVVIHSINDTALAAVITVDTIQRDVRELWWGFGHKIALEIFDSTMLAKTGYHDTVLSLPTVKSAGVWYLTTWLCDAAGNRSGARIDSAEVLNKKPYINPLPDTTIKEDTLWLARCIAGDWNNDTLRFSFVQAPAGATIDSASGVISWTPTDAAVGVHVFVVQCSDGGQNGAVFDTMTVTVLNVNEPPVILFRGDSVAFEDSAYAGTIMASDPDPQDSLRYTLLLLPPWMTLFRDTLRGSPGNEHVGCDTVHVMVTDRGGLQTELKAGIRVINTNDPPVIKQIERPALAYEDSGIIITVTAIDVDAGDSLYLAWQNQPSWLTGVAFAHEGNNNEWQFTLSGRPGAGDNGMAHFSFTIADRDDGAVRVSDSVYVVDRPNTRIAIKQVSFGAARYVLSAATTADSGLTFNVKLVSTTGGTVVEKTAGSDGIVEFFPLADGRYAFSAYAIDGKGVREAGVVNDTLVIAGATTHTFAGDSVQWDMVGIPAGTYPADSVRGSGSLVTWDESGAERDIYGYYIPSREIGEVTGGKAYWRRSRDTRTVSIDPAQLVGSGTMVPLHRAKYGWNQVSNPYTFPVRWTRNSRLWKWSGNDYELCDSVLDPWQGYWVMTESADTVILEPRPWFGDSTHLTKRAAAYFAGKNEWQLRISLEGRTVLDRENVFGVSRTSSDGYDAADLFEPPRMTGAGYLFFPHNEWKKASGEFARDIRKNIQAVTVFQVGVAPWEGNDSAVVRIEGYDPEASFYIFIKDPSGLHEYNRDNGVALPPSKNKRYLTMFVSADRSLAQHLPLSFVCGNPYPNPCRSGNRIQYTLPYQWRKDGLLTADNYVVTIKIYDLAGRKVRDLAHRKQGVGTHTVIWDGKMNTGRVVGAGAYLLVLQAGDLSAKKKITVIR